jgi:magnesium chelatase subunit D
MAATFGVASPRAMVLAMRAMQLNARLAGHAAPAVADLTLAVALVLGPRATRLPETMAEDDAAEPPPPPDPSDRDENDNASQPELSAQTEILLDAAHALLPPGLLAALARGRTLRSKAAAARVGARSRSPQSGRPAGVRAGAPGRGARLALIDTIKAAAPWQRLRGAGPGRLAVRHDDLRIRRFVRKAEPVTIFAVDASGSAAAARLAEAKGAIELLLAEAYVARARVALVAFRGEAADVLLPPTRSLTRARRALAGLPGGGGTPLADGLDAARLVAEAERHHGRTPLIVVLTDGRANVAKGGEDPAEAALAAARRLAAAALPALFVDTATRPRGEGIRLADAMAARYLALPRADAASLATAVRNAA